MGQLWQTIETEPNPRQVLVFDNTKVKGKNTSAVLFKRRAYRPFDADIERVEHFRNMMRIINGHQGFL